MSTNPASFKYTKDHEWVHVEANHATVGITDFAQKQLGDIVFVELPAIGRHLKQHEVFGTIESVKAVSELFSPLSGEVIAVNADLTTHPEAVNSEPNEAWMIRLKPSAPAEASHLMDATAYNALVK